MLNSFKYYLDTVASEGIRLALPGDTVLWLLKGSGLNYRPSLRTMAQVSYAHRVGSTASLVVEGIRRQLLDYSPDQAVTGVSVSPSPMRSEVFVTFAFEEAPTSRRTEGDDEPEYSSCCSPSSSSWISYSVPSSSGSSSSCP